jgi:hypothetical protein
VFERRACGPRLQPEKIKLKNFNIVDTGYLHGLGQGHSDETSMGVNNSLKSVNTNLNNKQYGWVADKFHNNEICRNIDYFFNVHSRNDISSMDQFIEVAQG